MGSQRLLYLNVSLLYQEGRSLFWYMMQGLNPLIQTVTVTGHTRVRSPQRGKKERFLGFHPDRLPVLMTTATKQRGGGKEEASTKAIGPVNGASSSQSKPASLWMGFSFFFFCGTF